MKCRAVQQRAVWCRAGQKSAEQDMAGQNKRAAKGSEGQGRAGKYISQTLFQKSVIE